MQREKKRVAGNEENEIINLFESINPSYKQLFNNKTERDASTRLLKEHGIKKLTTLIKALPDIISRPYAPRITTPYQLEKKMGELKIFMNQENSKAKQQWTII